MNPHENADSTLKEQGSMVPLENELRKNNPWAPTDHKETRGSNPIALVHQSGSSRVASFPFPKRFGIEDVEPVLSSYSHVDSSSNLSLDKNQNSSGSREEMPRGQVPAPLWPRNNLNSPPKFEAGVLPNTHKLPPSSASVTPDDTKQLGNHQTLNSSAYRNSSQEKHNTKTSLKSTGTDATDDRCKEPHHRAEASSSAAMPSKKKKKEEKGGGDQSKKTQQKRPKKKKHRPKVIKEDGPKKRTKN